MRAVTCAAVDAFGLRVRGIGNAGSSRFRLWNLSSCDIGRTTQQVEIPSDGIRCLSTKTKTKPPPAITSLTYLEKKRLKKEMRRVNYEEKLEKISRLKTRRDASTKGEKRSEFRSFFVPKKVGEEYMDRKARQAGLDWKIDVGVILQRWNILAPDLPQWASDWEELDKKLERYRHKYYAYPKELQFDEEEKETPRVINMKKAWLDLFPKGYIHPPSRVTEADRNGNTKTVDRKLSDWLFWLVRDAKSSQWHFPTVSLLDGETLVDAGRRALDERLGHSSSSSGLTNNHVRYWCESNAPWAVDMMPFPDGERDQYYGTKKFFLKFYHYSGNIQDPIPPSLQDFAWLNREEIIARLKDDGAEDQKLKLYHYML